MAAVILDRFIMPIGRLRKELIYVNNVANDDTVISLLSKIHSANIRPVNYTGTFTKVVSIDFAHTNGREVLTIRDPDGVSGTVYELEVNGQ